MLARLRRVGVVGWGADVCVRRASDAVFEILRGEFAVAGRDGQVDPGVGPRPCDPPQVAVTGVVARADGDQDVTDRRQVAGAIGRHEALVAGGGEFEGRDEDGEILGGVDTVPCPAGGQRRGPQ